MYGWDVPLRVLFLTTDLEIGGTPRVVRDLAIKLRSDRISTAVASLSPWGPVAGELLKAGIRVIELGATASWQLPRVVRDVTRLARSYDVIFSFLIHANTVAAITSAFKRDVRFIQSIQTTQINPKWHWWLQGLIERAADKIVVPSASVAEAAQTRSHIGCQRMIVIPNAIDISSYARLATNPFAQPWTRVGFIGRLDPVKRVTDLVEAVSRLDRAELHIFGEGEDRSYIESAIHKFGCANRVTLHGQLTSAHTALEQIDVLVLPSDAEGFGLVLIEAMAAGVPVIATDVPGIRDAVQDGVTGLLVPARNPQMLALAIDRLRTDSLLRQQLINQARTEVSSRYAWGPILSQYRRLLGVE